MWKKVKQSPIEKELQTVLREEEKLGKLAAKGGEASWKKAMEEKIPEKVYTGLKKAFSKAFGIVFDKGTAVIEKTYDRSTMEKDHEITDYAIKVKGGKKELRKLKKDAQGGDLKNMAISTVEGIGLGALGIGMPDIVIFVGMLLKGIYECAMHYGVDYEKTEERLLILKMMEAAMSKGEDWNRANGEVNQMLERLLDDASETVSAKELKVQTEQTANVFAMDMLLVKFIQGMPIVGILGGAGNPVYYRKVLRYVQLKYRKRYLMGLEVQQPMVKDNK